MICAYITSLKRTWDPHYSINAALWSDWPLHTSGASPRIQACDTRPLLLVWGGWGLGTRLRNPSAPPHPPRWNPDLHCSYILCTYIRYSCVHKTHVSPTLKLMEVQLYSAPNYHTMELSMWDGHIFSGLDSLPNSDSFDNSILNECI